MCGFLSTVITRIETSKSDLKLYKGRQVIDMFAGWIVILYFDNYITEKNKYAHYNC